MRTTLTRGIGTALHGFLQTLVLLAILWMSETIGSHNAKLGLATSLALTMLWGWVYTRLTVGRWDRFLTFIQSATCVLAIGMGDYLPIVAAAPVGMLITYACYHAGVWISKNTRTVGRILLGVCGGFFLTPALYSMTTLGALCLYVGEEHQYPLRVASAFVSGIPLGILLAWQKETLLMYTNKAAFTLTCTGFALLAVWVKQPAFISTKTGIGLLCAIGTCISLTSWAIQWLASFLTEPAVVVVLYEEPLN